uniref:Cation-transporting ATPase n=1 Tax=Monodelphis domestica TaxID=13616 RepID=A0A5F8GN63_MONDO
MKTRGFTPGGKEREFEVAREPVLRHGDREEDEVFGYQTQNVRRALCLLGSVLSCGFLMLIFYWRPQWNVWAHCAPCPLREADVVLLRTTVSSLCLACENMC